MFGVWRCMWNDCHLSRSTDNRLLERTLVFMVMRCEHMTIYLQSAALRQDFRFCLLLLLVFAVCSFPCVWMFAASFIITNNVKWRSKCYTNKSIAWSNVFLFHSCVRSPLAQAIEKKQITKLPNNNKRSCYFTFGIICMRIMAIFVFPSRCELPHHMFVWRKNTMKLCKVSCCVRDHSSSSPESEYINALCSIRQWMFDVA